jgi:hypothetical protein
MNDDPPNPSGMPSREARDSKPEWDQDQADRLIGKYVLVGITCIAADGTTVASQDQFHGRVTRAQRNVGIAVACEGILAGKEKMLPPDPTAFQPAGPGHYTLRSTGEVVVDPELLSSSTIYERSKA